MPDRAEALEKYGHGYAARVYDSGTDGIAEFRAAQISRLELKPGQIVLDVGCGAGFSFTPIEEAVGPYGKIIGIEQSKDQLSRATKLIETQGWRNIELVNSPVENAAIPEMADAAIFMFTHDIMRTPRAIDNVVEHLKPGAHVLAAGVKWGAPWKIRGNLGTWRSSRIFTTTREGLFTPWSHLKPLLSSLEVTPMILTPRGRWPFCGYVALARK